MSASLTPRSVSTAAISRPSRKRHRSRCAAARSMSEGPAERGVEARTSCLRRSRPPARRSLGRPSAYRWHRRLIAHVKRLSASGSQRLNKTSANLQGSSCKSTNRLHVHFAWGWPFGNRQSITGGGHDWRLVAQFENLEASRTSARASRIAPAMADAATSLERPCRHAAFARGLGDRRLAGVPAGARSRAQRAAPRRLAVGHATVRGRDRRAGRTAVSRCHGVAGSVPAATGRCGGRCR